MAMDPQQTFNWLVAEKTRLEGEVEQLRGERDRWQQTAFNLAFEAARNNPSIRAQIERERRSEVISPDVLDFVMGGHQQLQKQED